VIYAGGPSVTISFSQRQRALDPSPTPTQGPIFRGVGGSTLPMIFLTPRVAVDLSSWGVDLTPVLVLHVSACGASTLSPVGDPQCFFLQIGHCPNPTPTGGSVVTTLEVEGEFCTEWQSYWHDDELMMMTS